MGVKPLTMDELDGPQNFFCEIELMPPDAPVAATPAVPENHRICPMCWDVIVNDVFPLHYALCTRIPERFKDLGL